MMLWYLNRKEQRLTIRIGRFVLQVKGPKAEKLFSERYGFAKPVVQLAGWRLFLRVRKDKKDGV